MRWFRLASSRASSSDASATRSSCVSFGELDALLAGRGLVRERRLEDVEALKLADRDLQRGARVLVCGLCFVVRVSLLFDLLVGLGNLFGDAARLFLKTVGLCRLLLGDAHGVAQLFIEVVELCDRVGDLEDEEPALHPLPFRAVFAATRSP